MPSSAMLSPMALEAPALLELASGALADIKQAQERLADSIVRTPLVRLAYPEHDLEIYLKLEMLQPIGSFKIRGSGNAIAQAQRKSLKNGIVTASAGNMAQGVAWHARRLGVPCLVIVPDHAPQTKLNAIERMGGTIKRVPFEQWWEIIDSGQCDHPGHFVHPVSDPNVVLGNATIGLEILEDLPDVQAIYVPFGGGGLISGIGCSLRAAGKPHVQLIASEVATGAPLESALRQGKPVPVSYTTSFVDGIGSTQVLQTMWPLVSELVSRSVVCKLDEVADAVRLLATRNRVVAEGAGAASVAAALKESSQRQDVSKVVCVISGGNIDAAKLATILDGSTPAL